MLRIALAALVILATPALAQEPVSAGTNAGKTLTAPTSSESFDFVVYGDRTGGPREGVAVLERAVEMTSWLDPDLVMTVGDLIEGYSDEPQWMADMDEFTGVMDRLGMPWYPVAGNHDVYARPATPEGHSGLYKEHFGPLYYSFDHKFAHFIVLFSDESMSFSNPAKTQNMSQDQRDWLAADLASTDAKQIFVFIHHPRWTPKYNGNNWDKVHTIFKADGRPTTAFAGHIHNYRDDGKTDNVHYVALATTGGWQTRGLEESSFHHLNLVSVRPGSVANVIVPIDAIHPSSDFPGAESETIIGLNRSGWASVSGKLAAGGEAGAAGSVTLTMTNPTDRSLPYSVGFNGPSGWTFSPRHSDGILHAGESATLEVSVTAAPVEADVPSVDVILRARYPLGRGGEQSVTRRFNVGVSPAGMNDEAVASDTSSNGVLKLDGRSAVRIELADNPDSYTVECWVRGSAPSGRAALVAKTEGSAYGIFWSDTGSDNSLPAAYAHDGGRYLSVEAAEPWAWDKWAHVALTYDGQTARFFVNGALQGEDEDDGGARHNSHPLFIGADTNGRGEAMSFFKGEIDEVRVSSVARYDSDFTPAGVFERDESTLVLMHFDRDHGPAFGDDSGRGNHGWRVGAAKIEPAERD